MKKIKRDIADRAFEPVYLIYGPEAYLRRDAKQSLKAAIVGDDTLNYTYREGKDAVFSEIRDIAETVPFFAEKRLIILENTGWAKSGGDDLAEYLPELPASTVLVLAEEECDKRTRLFKAVTRCGYAAECASVSGGDLRAAAAASFRRAGFSVDRDALDLFVNWCGSSLDTMASERDKLISYAQGRERITAEDVEAVCTKTLQDRVFEMIEAVMQGRPAEAYLLYEELRALREPSSRILYLLTQHISRVLAACELDARGTSSAGIAETLGVKPYAAGKYAAQGRRRPRAEWQKRLEKCVELDHAVKRGDLDDRMAVELALVELSRK